jgi:hypothetical protein
VLFFQFPEDARRDAAKEAVEFSVVLGPYEGTVRVPKRSFQGLLDQSPTPQRCLEAFHLQRVRFELNRRTQAASAAAYRGWECRDHRTGSARTDAACRSRKLVRLCLRLEWPPLSPI